MKTIVPIFILFIGLSVKAQRPMNIKQLQPKLDSIQLEADQFTCT